MGVTPAGRGRIALLSAALLAVTGGISIALLGSAVSWTSCALLAVVVALSEARLLHLAFGQQRWSFAWSELPLAALLMRAPSVGAVVAVMVGVAFSQVLRRQPPIKALFNVAQFGAATAAATAMTGLGGGIGSVAAAMGVFFAVNTGAVAVAVAATTGRRTASLILEALPLTLLPFSANAAVGLLAGWLSLAHLAAAVLVVPPLVALWTAQIERTRRATSAAVLVELARADIAALGSVDHVGESAVRIAAGAFGDARAELLLMTGEGLVSFVLDGERVRRTAADPSALDAPAVASALGRHSAHGVANGRPFVGVALRGKADVRGVLLVTRRATTDRFNASDSTLLTELASRVVERLDRLADERPAMTPLQRVTSETSVELTLRDAARRLLRSTEHASQAPDDVMRELQAVESAVASLLGALALKGGNQVA